MIIYLPKTKEIVLPAVRPRIGGWFKFEAFKPGQYRRVLADWFPNLILDAGLNRWGTGAILGAVQVGTGSATPLVTDTALQTRVAGTSTLQSQTLNAQASAPYYGYSRLTYRFSAGAAAGNLTEVGAGWTVGPGNLFSRSLILDGFGVPTTITVLSDEFLDVTYELRCYAPDHDTTYNATISGVVYACTTRPAQVTTDLVWFPTFNAAVTSRNIGGTPPHITYNGALGVVTGSPSGVTGTFLTPTTQAYSNNSLYIDMVNFSNLNEDNLSGGIRCTKLWTTIGGFQTEFNPPIPKISTQTLSLAYRVGWGRYTPGSP